MELQTIRPNIVQAIRAYRVDDLMKAAETAGQHFLYANLSSTQSKQEVLEGIAQAFTFPAHFGKNLDALYDCMTDLVHKAGQQPGFVAAARGLPRRRRVLGRTANTVQVLLFFSVARSLEIGSWERATDVAPAAAVKPAVKVVPKNGTNPNFGMNMPMMSSAFDTAAWLSAA